MNQVQNTVAQTMSSREIAELTGKELSNIHRDIRAMLVGIYGEEHVARIVPEQYRNRHSEFIRENAEALLSAIAGDDSKRNHHDERGFSWERDKRGYIVSFSLDKTHTMTLISGYNVKLRKAIIDRWQELETKAAVAPAIPAQLSRLQLLELAMQAEQERLALEVKATALEAKVTEQAPKVAFADQVEVAPDAIEAGLAAKLIGTGRTRLLAFMREIRWINRFNQPYQDKIEAGLLDVKVSPWEHPKHGLQQQITTLVLGKGLVKLQSLWNERQHAIGAAHMQPAATQPGTGV